MRTTDVPGEQDRLHVVGVEGHGGSRAKDPWSPPQLPPYLLKTH